MLFSTVPNTPAIYVRWSTDEQGSGTTLEEQRQTCLSFLKDRDWPVCDDLIFIDDGYSASSLERPAMKKLRKLVESGSVDAVVVYKLDRLTRNIVDAVDLVLREWEGRCALVSVTQSAIDTTNAMGRQFFTLMASFAEFEREMIRDRTMSGKKRRAMQGRNPGMKIAYGYMADAGDLVIDQEKASIVRRIYHSFVAGNSMMDIARQLNQQAVPAPGKSRGWSDRTIRYMLMNPLYVGTLEYGKTSVNTPQKRKQTGRSKTQYKEPRWAVVPGAFEATVSHETWNIAQALIKQRGRDTGFISRAASSSYLMTGMMTCKCGFALSGVTGKGLHYYRCRNTAPGACPAGYIRTDHVDVAVMEAIRSRLGSTMGQTLLQASAERAEAAKGQSEAAVVNLKSALSGIQKQKEKARRDYTDGDLSGRLYSELVSEIDSKESEIRSALRQAEFEVAHPTSGQLDGNWLLSHIEQVMSDSWEHLEQSRKKSTLRALVAGVVAYREGKNGTVDIEITLNSLDTGPPLTVSYEKQVNLPKATVS